VKSWCDALSTTGLRVVPHGVMAQQDARQQKFIMKLATMRRMATVDDDIAKTKPDLKPLWDMLLAL